MKLFDNHSTNASKAKYKTSHGERINILTPKQILPRLLTALQQVKAGNKSENSVSKIRKITYSLYCGKEITKIIYNNIMNSVQLQYKTDTIYMNSEIKKSLTLID